MSVPQARLRGGTASRESSPAPSKGKPSMSPSSPTPPPARRPPPGRMSPGTGRPMLPRRLTNGFGGREQPPRRSPGYERFDGSPAPPSDRGVEPPCTVYVGGLPHQTTIEAVQDFFDRYGAVERVKLIHHRDTGEFRGFGFVTFYEPEAALDASENATGREVLGKTIRCNLARYNRVPPGGIPLGPAPPIRGPPPPMRHFHERGPPMPPRSLSPRTRLAPPRRGPPGFPPGSPGPPPYWSRSRSRSPGPHGRPMPPRRPRSPVSESPSPPPAAKRTRRPRSMSPGPPAVAPGALARLQAENRSLQEELAAAQNALAGIRSQQAEENQKSEKLTTDVKSFTAQLLEVKEKARGDKKRSQQRGHRLVVLTQAVQDVMSSRDAVKKAQLAHEAANEHLAAVVTDIEAYVEADGDIQAREERNRAVAQAQRSNKDLEGKGAGDGRKGADENNGRVLMNGNDDAAKASSVTNGVEDSAGHSGLHMKPFKFSFDS